MKKNRHEAILSLISQQDIGTQEELMQKLNDLGYKVTQATVSRDIKYLKLIKTPVASGQYKYSYVNNEAEDFSGKYCPHRTLDLGWQRFLDKIAEKLNESEDVDMEELEKTINNICNSIDNLTELIVKNEEENSKLLSDIDYAIKKCKALHKSTE